jgi:hypothetical protein
MMSLHRRTHAEQPSIRSLLPFVTEDRCGSFCRPTWRRSEDEFATISITLARFLAAFLAPQMQYFPASNQVLKAECCAISILGGIQPEKIKSLSSSLSDDVRAYRAATLRRSKRLAVAASLRVAIASAEYLPCFQFAFRLRSRPSGARPSISVGREFGEVAPIAVVLDLVYPVRARNTQHGRNIGQPDPEITGSAAAPPTRRTTTASSDETMANATAEAQIGLSNANQGRTLAADSAATPRSAIITPSVGNG